MIGSYKITRIASMIRCNHKAIVITKFFNQFRKSFIKIRKRFGISVYISGTCGELYLIHTLLHILQRHIEHTRDIEWRDSIHATRLPFHANQVLDVLFEVTQTVGKGCPGRILSNLSFVYSFIFLFIPWFIKFVQVPSEPLQ